MKPSSTNLVIAEPSYIIYEGLTNILSRGGNQFHIFRAEELYDVQQIHLKTAADIVLINPSLIQNQLKAFNSIRKELEGTQWIGIVYNLFDQQLLAMFDAVINVNDTPDRIVGSIQKLHKKTDRQTEQSPQAESLSEREIEVLKLLVAGNSNKEIADKLFISTHTVITHRKNISQKTGIKSVSGLTIYAVVNNIIQLE